MIRSVTTQNQINYSRPVKKAAFKASMHRVVAEFNDVMKWDSCKYSQKELTETVTQSTTSLLERDKGSKPAMRETLLNIAAVALGERNKACKTRDIVFVKKCNTIWDIACNMIMEKSALH